MNPTRGLHTGLPEQGAVKAHDSVQSLEPNVCALISTVCDNAPTPSFTVSQPFPYPFSSSPVHVFLPITYPFLSINCVPPLPFAYPRLTLFQSFIPFHLTHQPSCLAILVFLQYIPCPLDPFHPLFSFELSEISFLSPCLYCTSHLFLSVTCLVSLSILFPSACLRSSNRRNVPPKGLLFPWHFPWRCRPIHDLCPFLFVLALAMFS